MIKFAHYNVDNPTDFDENHLIRLRMRRQIVAAVFLQRKRENLNLCCRQCGGINSKNVLIMNKVSLLIVNFDYFLIRGRIH